MGRFAKLLLGIFFVLISPLTMGASLVLAFIFIMRFFTEKDFPN